MAEFEFVLKHTGRKREQMLFSSKVCKSGERAGWDTHSPFVHFRMSEEELERRQGDEEGEGKVSLGMSGSEECK